MSKNRIEAFLETTVVPSWKMKSIAIVQDIITTQYLYLWLGQGADILRLSW